MNDINKIGIIGGGSAGLVAALILKTKFPHISIDIIRSEKIGIIGVGEGSTEHWSIFMDFVGINPVEMIKECDASFKSGIMFKGWGENDYLQSISGRYNQYHQNYPYIYSHMISHGFKPKDLVSSHAWESKVNTFFLGQESMSPTVQYHFNTNKLNEYLIKKCIERNIKIIDDEILDVLINSDSGISELVGEKKKYSYDFYIDSTGWKRLLIEKLGAKWQDYSKYLKMKKAIVFPTLQENEIPMWTTAQAMDYGWMFTIPVWGRNGNGYIFDSDYISSDQAHAELESFLGKKIEIAKEFSFIPGALDRPWIKNCCAVGLSASFVEPLEASSIGTSIQQSFLICERLINYSFTTEHIYNKSMDKILNNIRDFIALHYISARQSSNFWKDMKNINLPDSLSEKLEIWKHKLPVPEDFDGSNFFLFTTFHHILVLHGLGLINEESIRKEYLLSVPKDKKEDAEFTVSTERNLRCQTIPHKTMLDVIRNIKNENY
jgi:tryptophan halogenase